MTPNEAKNEYNKIKDLQSKLQYIKGIDSDLLYAKTQGMISVLLDVYNGNHHTYTANIEKFIKENK